MTINVDVSVKKHYICEKDIWKPSSCISVNGNYLASIMYDSVIICDEVLST